MKRRYFILAASVAAALTLAGGYDIDMVQQQYGLALTYGIIWAREGFR